MSPLASQIRAARSGPDTTAPDGTLTGRFRFPPDFVGFQGHFPGNPVLPAFVQVAAARVVVEDARGTALIHCALDRARFRRTVGPEEPLSVACTPLGEERFAVRLTAGTEAVAGFTLTLAAAPPPETEP